MKTLVIQLARFGDIFQTWPTLFALSEAGVGDVHVLVRERFVKATVGLPENIKVHVLPSTEILEPFYNEMEENCCLDPLSKWLENLEGEKFDQVINLSFSPFSSYLTSYLEIGGAISKGYTRHADGYFQVPDDASAYFYAQVGVDRPNRIHLVDLFAMVAGVELKDRHRHPLSLMVEPSQVPVQGEYVVIHIGASDLGKAPDPRHLKMVIQEFLDKSPFSLVLVGVESERDLAYACKPELGSDRIYDLVGQTSLPELIRLVSGSKALIGGDSAPIQVASLLNRPILNLRNENVNSFETGPFSESYVVMNMDENPHKLIQAFRRLVDQSSVRETLITSEISDQQWNFLQSLYMGGSYPTRIPRSTAGNLTQILDLLPQVFVANKDIESTESQRCCVQFDLLLENMERNDPLMGIVIRWFNTERLRIPPGNREDILQKTLHVFEQLFLILSDWTRVLGENVEFLPEFDDLDQHLIETVKNFRFVNVAPAMDGLEKILPLFLSPGLTKVQGSSRPDFKFELEKALQISDFERVADLLEYDFRPLLKDQDMLA